MQSRIRAAIVCSLVVFSGCIGIAPFDSGAPSIYVDFTPLPETQEDGFEYHGKAKLIGVGESCIENLSVAMYSANLTPLGSVDVGTLCYTNESPTSKNITLTSESQPAYIVFESPDFWDENGGPGPTGRVRNTELGYYKIYPIERPDQIKPTGDVADPVPTNNTTSNATLASILQHPVSGVERREQSVR